MALYETAGWSSANIPDLMRLFFNGDRQSNPSVYSIKKRRRWFIDDIINKQIGFDTFVKKLCQQGKNMSVEILNEFPELSAPLARYQLTEIERKKSTIDPKERLALLRFEPMNDKVFQQFLDLFKETGSDVNQRQNNYIYLLDCAVWSCTDVEKVFQWLQKRLANEQLIVLQSFLAHLSTYNNRFHLELVPKNLDSLETIFELAMKHVQRTVTTLSTIV